VRRALEGLEGVNKAEVSFLNKRAVVIYDPMKVKPSAMVMAVEEAGYRAVPRTK
jgi:copper chaperone